jgi:mono/diheme cytochrome c family protein
MRTTLIVLVFAAAAATTLQAAGANAGKVVYDKTCRSCHGVTGTPNPAVVKMMKVDIQDLKSPAVQGMSDADLIKIITDGKGKMKPVPNAAGSASDVVAYLRTWKK